MRRKEFEREKSRFSFRSLLMLLTALVFMVASCEKEPEPEPDPEPEIPEEILIVNEWIWEGLDELYLWEKFLPTLNYTLEPDPEAYFYKLLYKDDRYSWIVDDYDELVASFEGVELATGMNLRAALVSNNEIIFVVRYVTPNSPAEEAGVKRGDMIISVDGEALTTNNYIELYYRTSATFEFGSYDGEQVVHDGRYVEITAIELNQNPVVHSEVIEYEGARIGYFVYTQFTDGPEGEWLDTLDAVFNRFIAADVTDVIVDVRYNLGGSYDLAAHMAGVLGPARLQDDNVVFGRMVWNDLYNNYWKQSDLDDDGKADGEESSQLLLRFPSGDINLNMDRVYFLTTGHTASAPENVIVGLDPYVEVIQIGTTTYGKCYGSFTVGDWENPKRHNWAMQPIVVKFANADGFTDYVDGLDPDFNVQEYLLGLPPFGSFEDPLLAKALEEITGIPPATAKAAREKIDVELLPMPVKLLPDRVMEWPTMPVLQELD